MSQNRVLDSGEKSSKKTALKAPLAAALTSLEVQLDQELTRYRRTRTGYRTFSQPRVGISSSSKYQQLTAIRPTKDQTESSLKDSLQKLGLVTPKTLTTSVRQEEFLVTPETKINTSKSVPETQDLMLASATAADTLLQPQPYTPVSSKIQDLPSEQATPTESVEGETIRSLNAMVATKVREQNQSDIAELEDNTNKQPNDYLQSSEALLRSLAEEEPKIHKSTNSNDSLLSPLGIGSMLLLLLASLTLGYVIFNPKSVSRFSLNGLFAQNAPTTAEHTGEVGKNVKTVEPTLLPIPKYPNLASDEFPEVRDPNDVVSLKPKSQPTPPALSNPSNLVRIPNVQPPVGLTSTPQTKLKPPQTPSKTQQKLDTQIKPTADGLYHVITDNQGDRSFASARKIVPDAYLSPDGKTIYLGALKSKDKAQKLLQEVQAKGMKARIQ